MKTARTVWLTALFALTLCWFVSSCAGVTARKYVMIPAMEKMWPSIEKRVLRGLDSVDARAATIVALASMRKMLKDKDIDSAAQIRWDLLKAAALLGIDAMLDQEEIGPGVAESFREGIRIFELAFKRLL